MRAFTSEAGALVEIVRRMDRWLADIVVRASSLSERLGSWSGDKESRRGDVAEVVEEFLQSWCDTSANGDWERFRRRLRWQGLEPEAVHAALQAAPVVDDHLQPAWAETLRSVVKAAGEVADHQSGDASNSQKTWQLPFPIDDGEPLPFEEVLLPAVLVARKQLAERLGSGTWSAAHLPFNILTENAYGSLERHLMHRLADLCWPTLMEEFSDARPAGYGLLNLIVDLPQGTPKSTHYKAYLGRLYEDNLLGLFQRYPVLGRLMATLVGFWVESTAEFLQRLLADLTLIQRELDRPEQSAGSESQPGVGKVSALQAGRSDPHHRGRSVIVLRFESGLNVVYKPKDLGSEAAFSGFSSWCNARGLPLPLKALRVIPRAGYGWVEFVEPSDCGHEDAARRFYERSGMLLCMIYLLHGTDCHQENLIASGEHLVLVDLETLLYPAPRWSDASQEVHQFDRAAPRNLSDSVLGTGLLPRWEIQQNNHLAYDISGLGSIEPQRARIRVPRWKHVNSDGMTLDYEQLPLTGQPNVPTLDGRPLSPIDYLQQLIAGFERMYRFLLSQRRCLLDFSGRVENPLSAFDGHPVRFVFRPTKVYGAVAQKAIAPEALRNGVQRTIQLEFLARGFLRQRENPDPWPILREELQSMEQLDIPLFRVSPDSDALTLARLEPMAGFSMKPGFERVKTRLGELNESDLAEQVAIIKGTFQGRVAQTPEARISDQGHRREPTAMTHAHPLSSPQLLRYAREIADEISSQALRWDDRAAYWLGLNYLPRSERFQLQYTGIDLYHGNCGIALFLAAVDYVQGRQQFGRLALDALRPLQDLLQLPDLEVQQRFARSIGIGGATGLGSLIYSLVRISRFLADAALVDDARLAADLITAELIASDQQLDIMAGSAGAILGLLTLYAETRDRDVLATAELCGQHLLRHRTSEKSLPPAWKTIDDRPLTGFSHGAAGISYALLQLGSTTGDAGFLDAARDGMAYEQSVFSQAAANWPDLRSRSETSDGHFGFMTSWCHGATGIGMARLAALDLISDDQGIGRDIEVAIDTTRKHMLQGVDHLCCGSFGRIEMFMVAADKLDRPELRRAAQQCAARIMETKQRTGGFKLFANLPRHVSSPGFFQGQAGIGYLLLRLANREMVPSVLLWE